MSVILCGSEEIAPAREVCHREWKPFPVRIKPLKVPPPEPVFKDEWPPCCYDFPCKAHCFKAPVCKRPSGRYDCSPVFPGCCPPPSLKCPHNYKKREPRDPEKPVKCHPQKCALIRDCKVWV